MKDINVKTIVEHDLKTNGYDGLFNSCTDCCCNVGDIAPCNSIQCECQAGYEQKITKVQKKELQSVIGEEKNGTYKNGDK